jgi:hypothetical protein
MSRLRAPGIASATAALIALACSLPSDVSDEFSVELPDVDVILTIGDTIRLFPTVLRNGTPVSGFDIEVLTNDPAVALVDDGGLVRGVGVGFAEVTALTPELQNAAPAVRTVRVLRAVTIDTVIATSTESPDGRTVSWGEEIRIAGVGLDPTLGNIVFVGDRPARLKSYQAAPAEDTLGLDTLTVWIPVGAPRDSDVLVSRLGGSTASWPLDVRQQDVLERATRLRIDAVDNIDIPEMAIEVTPETTGPGRPCFAVFGLDPEDCFSDGFQIVAPPSGEMTVVIELDEPVSKFAGLLEIRSDSIGTTDDTSWLRTPFWSFCTDWRFVTNLFPQAVHTPENQSRTWTVPLILEPGQRLQLNLTLHAEPIGLTPNPTSTPVTTRYGLKVLEGYHSDLPPDAYEENDHCFGGQLLDPASTDVTLTFDTGADLDWFEFVIPGTPPPALSPVIESEPNGTLATADTIPLDSETSGRATSNGDTDFFTFFAEAGTALDISVATEIETGSTTLDSFLQLYFDGEPISFNDNGTPFGPDSRLTLQVPQTGWYVASVQDLEPRNDLIQDYVLRVRTLGPEARRFDVNITSPDGLPEAEFHPVISLFRDDRQTPLAAPRERLRAWGSLFDILLPGRYMLLLHNPPGTPAAYRLVTTTGPVS